MSHELNRECPYCGHKLVWDMYTCNQSIVYCDNDGCPVKPCTDATIASKVYTELLAITGDKE